MDAIAVIGRVERGVLTVAMHSNRGSSGALADSLYPGHGAAIATLWRDKQVEYTRLITLSDPQGPQGSRYFQSFWELTRASLRYTLERLQLTLLPAMEEALMGQYARLTCFPENRGVLQQLQARGMASAGLSGWLQKVLSVDAIRQFKTSPQSYALVQGAFPVQADEVLFVSSNAWDALGASWFG